MNRRHEYCIVCRNWRHEADMMSEIVCSDCGRRFNKYGRLHDADDPSDEDGVRVQCRICLLWVDSRDMRTADKCKVCDD
jgi:hypothetical protein